MLAMSIIDRVGRRTLMLIGSVGMAFCLAGAAVIFWTATTKPSGLAAGWLHRLLAFSQGAVIWVYISEMFPTAVRASGQSLGSATHWIVNALISCFPGGRRVFESGTVCFSRG